MQRGLIGSFAYRCFILTDDFVVWAQIIRKNTNIRLPAVRLIQKTVCAVTKRYFILMWLSRTGKGVFA